MVVPERQREPPEQKMYKCFQEGGKRSTLEKAQGVCLGHKLAAEHERKALVLRSVSYGAICEESIEAVKARTFRVAGAKCDS